MSIARLTESIRRAGEGISASRRVLLGDLTKLYEAPPPSTIRRIVQSWPIEGAELAGHRVRTQKLDGRLYLVIDPLGEGTVQPVRQTPLYHQFGRVVGR